ncbi:MAG: PAS domain-containing protein [Planctomycetes bacterium]|nr:PAS domain-containing protein [Planctomycetota bacterium]
MTSGTETTLLVEELTLIKDSLLASYARLEQRAEHVERELVAANAELGRKVAELNAVRSHLEAVLHALPSGVVVRDEDDVIVRVNEAACTIIGSSERALMTRSSHPALQGRKANGESHEYVRPDGERRVLVSRWSPVRSGGSVEIVDDRTEVETLQEQLHAQSKMAALGTISGGIAHEIRNPLNAVRGFAELLRREMTAGTRSARFAARICEGVDEADQIIASMLTFASPERLTLETIDPKELIDSAVEAAKRVLPENAPENKWQIISSTSAPAFIADRIKVRQALRNLVANALQAQPDGGAVDVSISLAGKDVLFRVCDAGPGIPPRLRARVAEPFFTTRAEGTGLGLALVHSIAELHDGRLHVSPSPSHLGGADITFRIPLQPQ